ncbi:MAG: hypothetical protein WA946_05165 [Nitrospirota bacterium]
MKKAKKGFEISHWKVNGTDAFAAVTPGWTDDELDIGPNNDNLYDDQNNPDDQIQELTSKNIHKGK